MIIVNLKNIKPMNVDEVLSRLEQKYPGEKEYLQAVKEVLVSIEEVYNAHPEFEKAKLIERLVEPERIITFRVPWVDDKGEVHVNYNFRSCLRIRRYSYDSRIGALSNCESLWHAC